MAVAKGSGKKKAAKKAAEPAAAASAAGSQEVASGQATVEAEEAQEEKAPGTPSQKAKKKLKAQNAEGSAAAQPKVAAVPEAAVQADSESAAPAKETRKDSAAPAEGGAAPVQKPSPAEVEALTAKAVADIKSFIDTSGGCIKACLPQWSVKYRSVLGGYRQFLLSRPEFTLTTVDTDGNFVLTHVGVKVPEGFLAGTGTKSWQKHAALGWKAYRKTVPAEERTLQEHWAAILKAAGIDINAEVPQQIGPDGLPTKPAPRVAPATAGAAAGGAQANGTAAAGPQTVSANAETKAQRKGKKRKAGKADAA